MPTSARSPAEPDLAKLLEAATGPSPLLDARLQAWAGLPDTISPTRNLDDADAFCWDLRPGTTWVMKGSAVEHVAMITAFGGRVCPVLYSGRGTLPTLALLAAFVRAHDAMRDLP